MIVGEDEDLGFACEPTKRRGVEDPITVAFEASSGPVWRFLDQSLAGTDAQRRTATK